MDAQEREAAAGPGARNVLVPCPTNGELVLDVLADGRIEGMEFLARL